MIIAQISDTHLALDTPDANQRIRDFALTVVDINALDPAPDVIVHTGDIVHNGRQDEYAQAVATLAKAATTRTGLPAARAHPRLGGQRIGQVGPAHQGLGPALALAQ